MRVYEELDYREAIKKLVADRRKLVPGFSFQKLAEQTDIQKSYLSRVINGTANLSSDQLDRICRFFDLDEDVTVYLELLLEYARTGSDERKIRLRARIKRVQDQHLDSSEYLEAKHIKFTSADETFYYIDPVTQIVHITLSVPEFQKEPERIAPALGVAAERVAYAIERLEKLRMIERSEEGFKLLVDSLHLPKQSPIYPAWRHLLRSIALQRMETFREDDYSFSVVFSADEMTKNKIQERFLQLLKQSESDVMNGNPSQVLQMNFDLFHWTRA